jgi:1-acyl-sn-glycerol-3-phosphate acyltransferase
MASLRTLIFNIFFYGLSIFFVTLSFLAIWAPVKMMYWAVRSWSRMHYRCARHIAGITIKLEGDLADQPVLYAVKHESMFETIDMPRLLLNPAVVAKKELFDIPLWGRAAIAYGNIRVDRAGGAGALRQLLSDAQRAIRERRPIVIFPEGTRVAHGEMPPLQSGFAGLYKMMRLPVVPIAVDSGKLIKKGRFAYQPGVITYRVGETIPAGLPREEIEARVHAAINALNEAKQA